MITVECAHTEIAKKKGRIGWGEMRIAVMEKVYGAEAPLPVCLPQNMGNERNSEEKKSIWKNLICRASGVNSHFTY